jgi:HEPN domain-containing protein
MDDRQDEINEWLQKARSDLLSAQILMKHDPPVLDTSCFHSQQAAEKVLKAFLVWKAVSFEKVHSLTYLLDLCEVQESGFATFREPVETLAPYAVEIRYPGEKVEVSREEAEAALVSAEKLWDYVTGFFPSEFLPFCEIAKT